MRVCVGGMVSHMECRDTLGPRACNLCASSLVLVGLVLLSLSARGSVDAWMAAVALMAGAGPGVQISLFHIGQIWHEQMERERMCAL